MWPNKPLEFIILLEDEKGLHFGLFCDGQLISVISLFKKERSLQFRKFATAIEKQGLGYGTKLLEFTLGKAKELSADSVWCHARIEKTTFYKKFHMKTTGKPFSKNGKRYIVMEKIIKP